MMNLRSRIRRNLLAASPAAAQYIPPQLAGQPPALGEAAGCTSSVWPFVAGAVVWAFFGEQIKAALHLGGAAAQKGISRAHAQLGTAEHRNASSASKAKTKLDLILDQVQAGKREVTFDTDGYTEEQVNRVIATARARGLHAARSGRFVLVRDLRQAASEKAPSKRRRHEKPVGLPGFPLGAKVTNELQHYYDGSPVAGWPHEHYTGTVIGSRHNAGIDYVRVLWSTGRKDFELPSRLTNLTAIGRA